jgi:hypothetical protein
MLKASRQPRRCCFPAQSEFAWRFDSSCWRLRSPFNPHSTAWRGVHRTPN